MNRYPLYKALIACLLAVGLGACTGEAQEPDAGAGKDELSLQVVPVVPRSAATTRLLVDENTVNVNFAISIFAKDGYNRSNGIDASTAYVPIPDYKRIKMFKQNKGNSSTLYTRVGSSNPDPALYLKRNAGAVDVYLYYPFVDNLTTNKLDEIPFVLGATTSVNYDYMVPELGKPITVDPQAETDNMKTIDITLKHIMAQLEFRFLPSFFGQDLWPTMEIATLDGPNGNLIAKIAKTGTYSFFNGSLKYSDFTSTYSYSGDLTDRDYYIDATSKLEENIRPVVIPPIELADTDADVYLSIKILFNKQGSGVSPIQVDPYVFSLKSLYVEENGVKRYGLVPGYKYAMKITIDNFVKFNGTPSKAKWTEESLDIPI